MKLSGAKHYRAEAKKCRDAARRPRILPHAYTGSMPNGVGSLWPIRRRLT